MAAPCAWRQITITIVLAVVAAGIVAAQSTATNPKPTSSSEELLAEVRALRAEIQQGAAASLRAQILLGRLQVEEQRSNTLTSQLAETRRALAAQAVALEKPAEAVRNVERLIAVGNRGQDQALADARAQLATVQQEEQRLRTQEATLVSQLTVAQQRWMEFSTLLDGLERGIPAVPRK